MPFYQCNLLVKECTDVALGDDHQDIKSKASIASCKIVCKFWRETGDERCIAAQFENTMIRK